MAAELLPIRLGLTAGDFYTLWAPPWRDGGDEWQAFLGEGDDVYGFGSVEDLVAFVRSGADNDLTDHPAWEQITGANAHLLAPAQDHQFDLVAVEELVAEKPSEAGVANLARTLAVVESIGSVCDLPTVTKFFNGNPTLTAVNAGADEFSGRAGKKRWTNIATVVGRNWDKILTAIDELVTTPDVDATVSGQAAKELAEPAPEVADDEPPTDITADETDSDAESASPAVADNRTADNRATADDVVLGHDQDFWTKVGIRPIRVMTSGGTFYTLRCYLDDQPVFLGRNGRISVFSSERALARYLADEHDHDLADLSTYDDIKTAATDGSLDIDISEDNIYVLNGLADDIADGPDTVDRDQLKLAVEFLQDLGDYSEEDTVDKALDTGRPLGRFISHVLSGTTRPAGPYAGVVTEFETLERFVESRLRRE